MPMVRKMISKCERHFLMLVFPYLFQLLQFYSPPWPIRVTERGWIRSVWKPDGIVSRQIFTVRVNLFDPVLR